MSTEVGAQLRRLEGIMARLRAENGCPWDREQDLRSLRPYLVEEAYEVLDEMDRVGYGGAWGPFCEELGDLLFQIVFHAQLAKEQGAFEMSDVCRSISDKLERRHPHVFGQTAVSGTSQVLANWAKLKADERKEKTGDSGSVLDGVPTAAPALLRAERLAEKASRLGFDWPDLAGVRAKLSEELRELDEAIVKGEREAIEHELGDVLFSIGNLARFLKTPAEDALRQANRRFTTRFHHIEAGLRERQVPFGEASLALMEQLWTEAKEQERSLPAPVGAPQVISARIRWSTHSAQTLPFVEQVIDILGGQALSSTSQEERRYLLAGLELVFTHADPGSQSERTVGWLELTAPSEAMIEAARAQLSAITSVSGDPAGLHFRDPDGNRWTYRLAASR